MVEKKSLLKNGMIQTFVAQGRFDTLRRGVPVWMLLPGCTFRDLLESLFQKYQS